MSLPSFRLLGSVRLSLPILLRASLLLGSVVAAGCTNEVFVETRDVTSGMVGKFSIGMTKEQALLTARHEDVHAIKPVLPPNPSIDFRNFDSLAPHRDGHALALFAGDRMRVVYMLSDGRFLASGLERGFEDPLKDYSSDRPREFIEKLKQLLLSDHALSIREVASSANHAWFDLSGDTGPDQGSPVSYDVWSFEVSRIQPAGASYTIYFADDRIVRIAYSRPRIRLE